MSLECSFLVVMEDINKFEICAVLTDGVLGIPVTVNLSTVCGTACCEYNIITTMLNIQ